MQVFKDEKLRKELIEKGKHGPKYITGTMPLKLCGILL